MPLFSRFLALAFDLGKGGADCIDLFADLLEIALVAEIKINSLAHEVRHVGTCTPYLGNL